MAPPITAANVIGAIAILAIVAFAFAMGNREDRGTGINPPTSPVAESQQYSTVMGKQEFNDDIVQNNEFLAETPMYLDAILLLISRSGYEYRCLYGFTQCCIPRTTQGRGLQTIRYYSWEWL
jgi:hypothetical protein